MYGSGPDKWRRQCQLCDWLMTLSSRRRQATVCGWELLILFLSFFFLNLFFFALTVFLPRSVFSFGPMITL